MLSETSWLGLYGRRQEAIDSSRLWIKRRWCEGVVTGRLRLHGLEWCPSRVCERTAVLLEPLMEARLHGLLVACRLWLLEGRESGLHRLLGWRRHRKACWLRHNAVLETKSAVLLWEPGHLLLHTLHVLHILQTLSLRSNLGHHIGIESCELSL